IAVRPYTIFVALFWLPSNISMCFLYCIIVVPKTVHNIQSCAMRGSLIPVRGIGTPKPSQYLQLCVRNRALAAGMARQQLCAMTGDSMPDRTSNILLSLRFSIDIFLYMEDRFVSYDLF
uniref:Uncharacterized protein n=1 Tax=Geospiza parvula TaxID=87175 RepID=A0A8C3MKX9_GEOPR